MDSAPLQQVRAPIASTRRTRVPLTGELHNILAPLSQQHEGPRAGAGRGMRRTYFAAVLWAKLEKVMVTLLPDPA